MVKKVLKTDSDLEKLIEDTRKLKRNVNYLYNPTKNLVINGNEILNFNKSGFPNLNDLKRILEFTYSRSKYKPIYVVLEDSIQYLFEKEEDVQEYKSILDNGYEFKGHTIKFNVTKDNINCIKRMLEIALSENAKIMTNENIVNIFEETNPNNPYSKLSDKKWQIKFTLKHDEILLYEKK